MKIYIIGPVGSGKTTFSKKLAEKYNMRAIARISAEFFQIMFYKNSDMKEFISAIK